MDNNKIKKVLNAVKNGKVNVADALNELKHLPYEDIGVAKVDHHRELRHGIPEVIFAEGKTLSDIKVISASMLDKSGKLLITKAARRPFMKSQV
jgi:NCAIR mutase (PurE)-related protein